MAESPTLAQAVMQLQARGIDRLDAQWLVLHVLGRSPEQRSWLLAHDDDTLSPAQDSALAALAQALLAGQPMAYLRGEQAFYGLKLQVGSGVLVPRPDTETLVDWALDLLPETTVKVLDLGTGSGAIALAIQTQRPLAQVWAVERSTDALAYVLRNAAALGLKLQLYAGSWYEALPADAGCFDCIVSNPPYVAEHDPHLPALHAEPLSALTSGPDGLDDVRHIIAHAHQHLRPGGWLLLEHGYNQAAAVRALLTEAGLLNAQSRTDLHGIERCSGAMLPCAGEPL